MIHISGVSLTWARYDDYVYIGAYIGKVTVCLTWCIIFFMCMFFRRSFLSFFGRYPYIKSAFFLNKIYFLWNFD